MTSGWAIVRHYSTISIPRILMYRRISAESGGALGASLPPLLAQKDQEAWPNLKDKMDEGERRRSCCASDIDVQTTGSKVS